MWNNFIQLFSVAPLLSLNNLLAALALGFSPFYNHQAIRIALIFGFFDLTMSLAGVLSGRFIGDVLGEPAHYVGSLFLLGFGVFLVLRGTKMLKSVKVKSEFFPQESVARSIWYSRNAAMSRTVPGALYLGGNRSQRFYYKGPGGKSLRRSRSLNWGIFSVALAVSFDNLSVGLGFGVKEFPIFLSVIVFGLAAFSVTLLGITMGNKIRNKFFKNGVNQRAALGKVLMGIILVIIGGAGLLNQ